MSDPARRALDHLRIQALRRAAQIVEGPPGLLAVFDPDWPASHLSNRLIVTSDLPAQVDVQAVLAFTDDAFEGRTLSYRKVDVLDDEIGRRLSPGLVEAGFAAAPVLVMMAAAVPNAAPTVIVVETLEERAVRNLVERGWRLEAPDFSDETVRQLVDRRDAMDRAGAVTRLGVRDPRSDEVVAKADLLLIEGVAEIDDVLTLPDHRGRGYASALVLESVRLAHAAGADLVYLEAAADDWPYQLYERLGFETVSTIHEHTRLRIKDVP